MALTTTAETPIPVRQVVSMIGGWVDRLGAVWVEGQIIQINRPANSGTDFLTLRDKLAEVSVSLTAPRGVIDALPTPLVTGAHVVVNAKPTVFPGRGALSLQVREIRLVGEGELLARLERRRRLLAAEGLFAPDRKRPLPFLPTSIGLITGAGSAAERDVLENVRRRWPAARVEVRHTLVQGPSAAAQIIAALESLDAEPDVDVIVIARGGGSVEDLLPFSDEALIRAVSAATTPVVSAIGHEPDNPILDLVADLRASTPTDAAKRVVPDVAEERARVAYAREQLRRRVLALTAQEQRQLDALRSRPVLADPASGLTRRSEEVAQWRRRAARTMQHRVERAEDDLAHRLAQLRGLSPMATMRRGYAVVTAPDGSALPPIDELTAGTDLVIRTAEGRIGAQIVQTTTLPLPDGPGEDEPAAASPEES